MRITKTLGITSLAVVAALVGSAFLTAPASAQGYYGHHQHQHYDHYYYHRRRHSYAPRFRRFIHDDYRYYRPRPRYYDHHSHGGYWGFSIRF